MRIWTGLLACLLMSWALLSEAAGAPAPKVVQVRAYGGTINIEFDQPMLTWSSQESALASHIRITPAFECTPTWENDHELNCGADRRARQPKLLPATQYALEIGKGLFSAAGAPLPATRIQFETGRPEINAFVQRWERGNPVIGIYSEWPISATELHRVLEVSVDGRQIAFELVPDENLEAYRYRMVGAGEPSRFRLQTGAGTSVGTELGINVKPGLVSSAGPLAGTQSGSLLLARINEPFRLRGLRCLRGYDLFNVDPVSQNPVAVDCTPDHKLQLHFSRRPSPALMSALAASLPSGLFLASDEPAEAYDFSRGKKAEQSRSWTVELGASIAARRHRVTLPASWKSVDDEALVATAFELDVGDFATSYPASGQVLQSRTSTPLLPTVTARNHEGRLLLNQWTFGAESSNGSVSRRSRAARNEVVQFETPAIPANLRSQGGIVLGGARNVQALAYAANFAAFNVIASHDGQRVLVWATAWGDRGSIAEAAVELVRISADGRESNSGFARTDSDGMAWLPWTREQGAERAAGNDDRMFIRVSKNGEQAWAPIGPDGRLRFDHEGDYTGRYSWRRDHAPQFGVSERPLYRPGDTVRYRWWLRERAGNRLVKHESPAAVVLSLYSWNQGKALNSWAVVPDAMGSVSGQLDLPTLLPDGYYIIGRADDHSYVDHGVHFQVARYEANALWAELATDRSHVLAGEALTLDSKAGYFSGEAAAGVALEFQGLLLPERLEAAFPAFSDYRFVDPYHETDGDDGSNPLRGLSLPTRTDAKGTNRFRLTLPSVGSENNQPIPFGSLEISVSASLPGKASATSAPAKIRYALHPRYVGLRAEHGWLDSKQANLLEAVVLDYQGRALPGLRVQLMAMPDEARRDVEPYRCELVTGQPSECRFQPPRDGRYRFSAQSEGAVGTKMILYAGRGWAGSDDQAKPKVELQVIDASDGVSPARVKLTLPFDQARVLWTVEYDHVLHAWSQDVDQSSTEVEVPVRQDWRPGVTLRALVLQKETLAEDGGFGSAPISADARLVIPSRHSDRLVIGIDPEKSKPGGEIRLRLSNPSAGTRQATIRIVDDAIYQQAIDMTFDSDPAGENWLGMLNQWGVATWYGTQGWQQVRNPFFDPGLARKKKPAKRKPEAPAASSPTAAAASASPADAGDLDRVEVTGSRITTADAFFRAPAHESLGNVLDILNQLDRSDGSGLSTTITKAGTPRRGRAPSRNPPSGDLAQARLRSLFLDSAYWLPALDIPAGEARELKITLPDNLTRWRVLVLASDEADGFALSETTLEAGLPLELRASLPSRLYVGDRSTATVSARAKGRLGAPARIAVTVQGAGMDLAHDAQATLAANGERSERLALAALEAGGVQLSARAVAGKASDGLSAGTAVISRWAEAGSSQSGWLSGAGLDLVLPALPTGAISPVLELTAARGYEPWSQGWLDDLRVYPHRCWEQTLSRAVGAAIAQDQASRAGQWPEAQRVVDDALGVAAVFQDGDGGFHFFHSEDYHGEANPGLSSYTLRAFDLLDELGHPTPMNVRKSLEERVRRIHRDLALKNDRDTLWRLDAAAAAAGAIKDGEKLDATALQALWERWEQLSWHGRSELVRALHRKPELSAHAQDGITRLREAGVRKADRRLIREERDFSYLMGSNLRDQCSVLAVLTELDQGEEGRLARDQFARGLFDLYAGGSGRLDTQSSAQCLMALRQVALREPSAMAAMELPLHFDARTEQLRLTADSRQASWRSPIPSTSMQPGATTARLKVEAPANRDASLNYVARIRYQLDQATGRAQGVGMALQRQYSVLRQGQWRPLSGAVREGDWMRVQLQVRVPALRHHIALTDFVPGGWVTRDISLSSVGGADIKQRADPGSWWFGTRQTGANEVRLYAETLPPGEHIVNYYAQAVLAGDYFAPPAQAELMYGRTSHASTEPTRVRVLPARP